MKLSALSCSEASTLAARTLGLDADLLGLTSAEGLASSLRRAASFMCPTSPARLIDAVLGAVRPVSPAEALAREKVAEMLDLLIGAGDLLELREEAERSTRLLYLAPPSYVERAPGSYLLLGVRPYGAPLVESELARRIDLEGHTRTLDLDQGAAHEVLARSGLQPLSPERWARLPAQESASELVERVKVRLDVAGASGDIEELQLLNPHSSVRYYKGRWQEPAEAHHGDFLGRRPQAYGAPLWCAVRVLDGEPQRLLEFPMDDLTVPARDEAWRYQMAIDAVRGAPQVYRLTPMTGRDESIVSFFSPVPSFAERYLQLAGLALPDLPRALFGFRVSNTAIPALEEFLTDILWMKPIPQESA